MTMLPQTKERLPAVPANDQNHLFAELYTDYFPRVYNYIRYRVDDSYDADDLTSLTFIKLLDKQEYYRPEKAPFPAWVFSIARNTVMDYYRRRTRNLYTSLEAAENLIDCGPGPDDAAAIHETRMHLHRALSSLSHRQREIIALKFWSGFSNRDIAEIMGISESNTGVILYRAMRQLRQILESQGMRIDDGTR